jgi:hypothetical protein
VADELN